MASRTGSVAKCAGPLHYGVGRPDGANTMIKTIQYLAEADPTRVLVAFDLKAAFQNVWRRAMLNSGDHTDPDLAAVFSTMVHKRHPAQDALRVLLLPTVVLIKDVVSTCGLSAATDPVPPLRPG